MYGPRPVRERPSPDVAFPCGSMSTSSVRLSAAARHAARFIAVVVLPTPPFWLVTAITRATRIPQLVPFQPTEPNVISPPCSNGGRHVQQRDQRGWHKLL